MQIGKHSVVKFIWELCINGKRIDGSPEGSTQTILIGHAHGLPPRLEQSLLGLEAGQCVRFEVLPQDAYGEFDPSKRQRVPRDNFPANVDLTPGKGFYAQGADGQALTAQVIAVDTEGVLVDFNHQHAGKTLEYKVEILAVRLADSGELEHGHVHGEGGVAHEHKHDVAHEHKH